MPWSHHTSVLFNFVLANQSIKVCQLNDQTKVALTHAQALLLIAQTTYSSTPFTN